MFKSTKQAQRATGSRQHDLAIHQTITSSEKRFLPILESILKELEYTGNLSQQETLIVSREQILRTLPPDKTLLVEEMEDFLAIGPDFLLARAALIIEIDGNIHDFNDHKAHKDLLRDYASRALGLEVYRISNDQIFNEASLRQVTNDLRKLIKERITKPDWRVDNIRFRKRISDNRKRYARWRKDKPWTIPAGTYYGRSPDGQTQSHDSNNHYNGKRKRFSKRKGVPS